ncbi:E3 ubiquitin-protein ligase rififylin isoform X2 [Acipenser ruthenus]|uniref:E3 ubiquitin-protein ligase rififylin isoform X2 n=1 Tax=Acipenser ruthenus TaxID=7906 RepID=UPI00145B790C|nr:E3 ubiquitin-protein ligase rififylin isoform X2 [Acipenser ruthenus]
MWASCCNWLCLDTQPVEEERGRSQRQAYTNSGFRPSPPRPAPEHTCKACGSHFSTSSRKHVCMDCKKSFCASCSVQPALSPRMCLSCQRCCGTAFLRTELMKLKVKELRDYLHLHEVSTELCREKEDLVELVLGQHTPPASQGPNPPATGATQATSQGGPSPHTEPAAEPLAEEGQQSSDTEEPLPPGRRASLSDLKELEDIDALTVRQLKEILARNFVNYKGCCEKWELMERVTRLYNEQKELQDLVASNGANRDTAAPPGSEENLCKICMDSPIDCVLLECGHMVTCTKCGKRMSECPICRQYVVRAVHVFKS